jgi:hypothetical protein
MEFHGKAVEVEAVPRPGEDACRTWKRALREVHRITGRRARDNLEIDALPVGGLDVLRDVADVVRRVVVRIDRRDNRPVGHRADRPRDVVVHAFERVEDQHAAITNVKSVATPRP